ncbi:MAG TPA: hypothetical protein VM165_00910, partial [Planctomycetaceae bacterium]|nr:hypothetical protein [Planctomycetaceae bacterium]
MWQTEHGLDWLRAGVTCVAAILGAIRCLTANEPDVVIGGGLIALAVLTLIVEWGKYVLRQEKLRSNREPHALDAVIESIHASLKAIANDKHKDC